MLSNVSWSEYLVGLVVLLSFYYLFLGATYFRENIKKVLSGKLPGKNNAEPGESKVVTNVSTIEDLEALTDDLRYAILERAGKQAGKAELLTQLSEYLANYTGLRQPAFRFALTNYIIVHAKEICGVVFSEEELNRAWDTLLR